MSQSEAPRANPVDLNPSHNPLKLGTYLNENLNVAWETTPGEPEQTNCSKDWAGTCFCDYPFGPTINRRVNTSGGCDITNTDTNSTQNANTNPVQSATPTIATTYVAQPDYSGSKVQQPTGTGGADILGPIAVGVSGSILGLTLLGFLLARRRG